MNEESYQKMHHSLELLLIDAELSVKKYKEELANLELEAIVDTVAELELEFND
jgi:hypothetical protein